jgi:hypothetical protein
MLLALLSYSANRGETFCQVKYQSANFVGLALANDQRLKPVSRWPDSIPNFTNLTIRKSLISLLALERAKADKLLVYRDI